MKPKGIMLIAGEASGDLLAAQLVEALREELTAAEIQYPRDLQPLHTGLLPRFYGAGGPRMAAAGVDLAVDLTRHSVIGLSDALKNYFKFRKLFNQLYRLALDRQPDAIICVDFSGFNRRFAHAIKTFVRGHHDWFHPWNPKLVQYVSPQVWASREDRAYQLARDFDLLLSILPFEKDWYARRVPRLAVEFVGHPMLDRFAGGPRQGARPAAESAPGAGRKTQILLLPGSRQDELRRHLPVMLGAWNILHSKLPNTAARIVLPDESLGQLAKSLGADLEIQIGDLPSALACADLAISKTGTVATECAFFGVPAVTLYKTSLLTYELGKRIVKVKSLTLPNLLAHEEVYPEFIQNAATPGNIANAALALLQDPERCARMKDKLRAVVSTLGGPGASRRAAQAITGLLEGAQIQPASPLLAGRSGP